MLAADWRENGYVKSLVATHRVLIIDPLGHGLSDKPHEPDAYLWPAVVDDLIAAMDDAEVDRAVVWGYSRGGWMAGRIAATVPDRVAGLILGGAGLTAKEEPMIPAWAEALCQGDWTGFKEVFPGPDEDWAFADAELDPRAFGAIDKAERRSDLTTAFDRVAAPALMYAGEKDQPNGKRPTADGLGVPLHLLPGHDHFSAFTASNEVLPLANAFVSEIGW